MKIFFLKFACLFCVVIVLQIIIGAKIESRGVYPPNVVDAHLEKGVDVIYFGDSVIRTAAAEDDDKSSIVEMLQKIDPRYKIADLSHGAYHPAIYASYIDYIVRSPHKPKALVIPVNLESFAPNFDMQPGYQFEEETFLLTSHVPYLNSFYRPLAIFGAVKANTITWEEYVHTPVYNEDIQVGIVKDYIDAQKIASITPEHVKDVFVLKYMYNLKADHRKLEALRYAIDIAQGAGIAVYVYITPIDHEGGEKYVGKHFSSHITQNAALVCAVAQLKKVLCLDLSLQLPDKDFNPSTLPVPAFPDEHLKKAGRWIVAEEVHRAFLASPPIAGTTIK